MASDDLDPRYGAEFQRGFDEPVAEAVEARRNPWLILLWALAVLLIAAGAFVISQNAPVAGDTVVPVLVLPVVFTALAPWLLGTGLAALVAAVMVKALRR